MENVAKLINMEVQDPAADHERDSSQNLKSNQSFQNCSRILHLHINQYGNVLHFEKMSRIPSIQLEM